MRTALFVYGTLRQTESHPMARYLAANARLVGSAHVPGRLYDLGPYPGMVAAQHPGEWVHGEVHELIRPGDTLAVLDGYEGCGPGDGRPFLFERCLVTVHFASGATRPCWVYSYRGPVEEAKRIPSGDYLGGH